MFCFFKRLYFRSPVYIKVNVVLRYYRCGPDFIYVKKVNDTVSRISLLNNYFELVSTFLCTLDLDVNKITPWSKLFFSLNQTSANNSTSLRYSKNIWYWAIIWGQILGRIVAHFILKNSANYSVFDSWSSNSGSIHQFYDLASTRLRLQSLSNRLDDEFRVGTPLRRNLHSTLVIRRFKFRTRFHGSKDCIWDNIMCPCGCIGSM